MRRRDHSEINNLGNPFKEYNIVIIPNFTLRFLKDNVVDVCLNKCSFAEMDKVTDSDRTVILLDCHKDDVYQLPPFQETYFNGHDAQLHFCLCTKC